jgi:hypothetical protein
VVLQQFAGNDWRVPVVVVQLSKVGND